MKTLKKIAAIALLLGLMLSEISCAVYVPDGPQGQGNRGRHRHQRHQSTIILENHDEGHRR